MKSKMLIFSSIFVLNFPVFATEPASWTLSKDYILDGVVENGENEVLTNKIIFSKFSADSDGSENDFMGEFIEADGTTVIKYQEISDTEVLNYVGKANATGYQGTWHSTNGDAGDFNLAGEPTTEPGSSGYQPLNIVFKQDLSPNTDILGEYDHIQQGLYGKGWQSANTGHEITAGKWYWEVKVTKAAPHPPFVGVYDQPQVHSYGKGEYAGNYWPLSGGAKKYCLVNDKGSSYGEGAVEGDVISVLLDMDSKVIEFAVNGSKFGLACNITADSVYPATAVYGETIIEANFGQSAWVYPELTQ